MYSKSGSAQAKNRSVLFLFILVGIVLGGFVGYYLQNAPYLNWLNFGREFGFSSPVILELGILSVTFGFMLKINIASVIFMILAVVAYKKLL